MIQTGIGTKISGNGLGMKFPTYGQRGCLQQRLSGNKYNKMIIEQKPEGVFLSLC